MTNKVACGGTILRDSQCKVDTGGTVKTYKSMLILYRTILASIFSKLNAAVTTVVN